MPQTIKFLDLYKQYGGIKVEIDGAIAAVIRDSAFIRGPYVEAFEREFARYSDASHCISVGNGTDALEIALEALDLPKGSEVIVPANTFIATSEAVTRSGFKVIFSASDSMTYTLDAADLRRRVTAKTSALIIVHLYGHPCDMAAISEIAREFDLYVIEDCAQAHGAKYRGARVGTLGNIACFSFYPGKNLGAYGDAGAIVTQDAALAERCFMLANHGRKEKYNHEIEGRNSRLDGLQAAILSVKLRHLDDWIERRVAIAATYREGMADTPGLVLPQSANWARHVYHLFVVRTARRDALQAYLRDNGVQTGIHYPMALPRLPAYRHLGQQTPSDSLNDELLSLPMGDHLTDDEVDAVIGKVRGFFV
jgi:dTDP-4-amino-4,6-dideoxygalactose transaminase